MTSSTRSLSIPVTAMDNFWVGANHWEGRQAAPAYHQQHNQPLVGPLQYVLLDAAKTAMLNIHYTAMLWLKLCLVHEFVFHFDYSSVQMSSACKFSLSGPLTTVTLKCLMIHHHKGRPHIL